MFAAGIGDGMAPLVVIALVASAVAAFFYLRVVVLMYFSEPAADGPTVTVPGAFTTAAITLGVLLTLLLGIAPSLALDWASGGGSSADSPYALRPGFRRVGQWQPTRSPESSSATRSWRRRRVRGWTASRSSCTARSPAATTSSPRPPCT